MTMEEATARYLRAREQELVKERLAHESVLAGLIVSLQGVLRAIREMADANIEEPGNYQAQALREISKMASDAL